MYVSEPWTLLQKYTFKMQVSWNEIFMSHYGMYCDARGTREKDGP